MSDDFDPHNPPELCEGCPDLGDDFFQQFTSEWLWRLSCSFCGLQLIKNKTILPVIQIVIDDMEKK